MVKQFYPTEYPVVIGIDFGTIYTRATYTIAATEGECQDITRWPSQPEFSSLVPTISLYEPNTTRLVYWGETAKEELKNQQNYNVIVNHKLLLEDSYASRAQLPPGLTDVMVIADFLREINNHIVSELRKTPARQFEGRYRYCFTVPAMWSDAAKSKMREAITMAGLIHKKDHHDRLMLIPEPEAAAIYCDKTYEGMGLNDNDQFMICDVGGGLMDLVTYHIKVDEDGNRKLQESVQGIGIRYGSKNVDSNMHLYITRKLGLIPDANCSRFVIDSMMHQFLEQLKSSYDGTEEQYISIPMNDHLINKTLPSVGLYNGSLSFSVEELDHHVYGPVVNEILSLIKQQCEKTKNIKSIILVGSFTASPYLSSRITQLLKPYHIDVLIPTREEMAVCRGAVYHGLNPTKVTVRVPRHWYGIEITTLFDEKIDPPQYKIQNPDGKLRCDFRFSCFVERGKPLEVSKYVEKKFTTFYPRNTACTFYAGYTDIVPRYVKQNGVFKVFEFEVPMPELRKVAIGEPIDLFIKIYFGEVEKRVEATILGKTYDISLRFN
ncbi:unnamed protein product [Cunninghamella blakesleeana]